MNRLKLVMGVVLVFAVGYLAGAICTGLYYNNRIQMFSAGGPPTDVRVRMFLDQFSRDLELTDSQKVEIGKILQDAQDQISELRRKTFPETERINDKSLELIREKLNDKQKEKFNSFYNKMKGFHDRFALRLDFPGRPFSRDIDDMKDSLNLSSEQVDKIEEIMKESFSRRETLMEESRKDQPPDFSRIRQEMNKIEDLEYENIGKILNGDQQEAYKKYREERRKRRPPSQGPGGGPMPPRGPDNRDPDDPERRPDNPLPPPNW